VTQRLRPTPLGFVLWAGPLVAIAGGALATTHYRVLIVVAVALALVSVVLLERFGVGLAIGVLALGGLDALPGPNLETTRVALSLTAQDVDVLVLIAVLIAWRPGGPRRSAVERRIAMWSVAFLTLWLATVARTVVSSPVPLHRAAFWCMDFAFFAALVPLFARAFRDSRTTRVFIGTCAIGAVAAALSQSVVIVSHNALSFLVHTTLVRSTNGLPRLYTGAIDLPFAALPLALGAALFGTTPRYRRAGAAVAIVCGVAVALALTRARYVGMTLGLGGAFLLWMCLSDAAARIARVRFWRALVAIVVCIGALLAYKPSLLGSSALTAVGSRVSSAVAVATGQSSTATVDVRVVEAHELTQYLGGRWLFGLGFLDPSSDYITGVPSGSIRNSDVGYLNLVMTMGAVGVALYCAPLLLLLLAVVRRRMMRLRNPDVEWLLFGGFAYLIATLVSSATLVILFSTTGVVAAAAMVGLVVMSLSHPVHASAPAASAEIVAPGPGPLPAGA
jgi:hypothetical protein